MYSFKFTAIMLCLCLFFSATVSCQSESSGATQTTPASIVNTSEIESTPSPTYPATLQPIASATHVPDSTIISASQQKFYDNLQKLDLVLTTVLSQNACIIHKQYDYQGNRADLLRDHQAGIFNKLLTDSSFHPDTETPWHEVESPENAKEWEMAPHIALRAVVASITSYMSPDTRMNFCDAVGVNE